MVSPLLAMVYSICVDGWIFRKSVLSVDIRILHFFFHLQASFLNLVYEILVVSLFELVRNPFCEKKFGGEKLSSFCLYCPRTFLLVSFSHPG